MKLTHILSQKEIDKLPQLDRIELRQKRDCLEKYYDSNLGSWYFLNKMFMIMGFIILVSISFYNISPETSFNLFSIIPLLIKLTIMFFVILLSGEIFITIKGIKEQRKLDEEYFDFKIEVKKK